jgi:hypothetical protein
MPKKDKAAVPDWKPAKDATPGNYGEAVSEAARTKPKPTAEPTRHGDGQAHQGPR